MRTRRVVFNMQDERPVWAPPPWVAQRVAASLPSDAELVEVTAPVSGRGDGGGVSPETLTAVRGAEIYLGLGLPREVLLAALQPPVRLRWVHSGAAGVASLLHPELRHAGVLLTNSAGIHGPAIAETVLGMMLHFARGFDHAVAAQHRSTWDATPFEATDSGVRELAGSSIGVLGFGGIGRGVAALAGALGMRITALRRRDNAAAHRWRDPGHGNAVVDVQPMTSASLSSVLESSDFVVVTLPSTTMTRGLIGALELARMRRDAVLINVARGDIVDEDALAAALRAGELRGAALDVFATEPLRASSPLWTLPNVLITPHVSATTPRFWERQGELILTNLQRYFAGEPLLNVVDPDAGY
jgi:phosphoglycerate dehydrogenase-like enzyme